jgi:hypothetical protein
LVEICDEVTEVRRGTPFRRKTPRTGILYSSFPRKQNSVDLIVAIYTFEMAGFFQSMPLGAIQVIGLKVFDTKVILGK